MPSCSGKTILIKNAHFRTFLEDLHMNQDKTGKQTGPMGQESSNEIAEIFGEYKG